MKKTFTTVTNSISYRITATSLLTNWFQPPTMGCAGANWFQTTIIATK